MRTNLSDQERELVVEMTTKVETYLRVRRFDLAEKAAKTYFTYERLEPEVHYTLGMIYAKQGQLKDSTEALLRAVKADQEFLDPKLSLIVSLCDVSRYDEAIAFYETSVDHFKTAPELVTQAIAEQHLATAKCYEQAELLAEAMTEYQKALSFHDIALARIALAGIYLKLGYLDKAERELELGLNIGAENAQIHVLWGLLQLKRKRFATAEQHFQSALHLEQGHGPAKALLAYAQELKLQAVAN